MLMTKRIFHGLASRGNCSRAAACPLVIVLVAVLFRGITSAEHPQSADQYQSRSGHPADHLPAYIKQVSGFGERPEWSHDGKRILFVAKPMGEVYELDLDSGLIEPKTRNFNHYGFTRANYLANGDILLTGPKDSFDVADSEARKWARNHCYMWVLDKSGDKAPTSLETLAAEGPAVSRTRMKIAWTHRDHQDPSLGENHARHFVANIVYEDGVPRLRNRRVVFDSHQLPFDLGGASLETQDFVPPDDKQLIFSVYRIEGGNNTDTFIVDLETGDYQNLTRSPGYYDEPEGVFPDGEHTCVEHAPSEQRPWPLCDIFKLKLDGSGEMQRLTHFSDFRGFKGTQGVVSDDGHKLCFQIGKSGDEAGVGYGFFVMDLEAAEEHLGKFQSYAGPGHPLQQTTDQFVAAWESGEPLPQISRLANELPLAGGRTDGSEGNGSGADETRQSIEISLDEAYGVQRSWVRLTLDEPGIGGVKGGVVTPSGQQWLGVSKPVGAILRGSGQMRATDQPTIISRERWKNISIETEIGFVVGTTIDRELDSVEEFKRHVRAIIPAIELPSGQWDRQGKPTPADLAAINVSAAAYIIGDEVPASSLDPRRVTIRLRRDGKELHQATGQECWHGPWETGHWLANFAQRQGIALEPGQVILCGALGSVQQGEPGSYAADFGELGTIRFAIR